MYDLTEYCDNYAKTFGSLWQYYRDETWSSTCVISNSTVEAKFQITDAKLYVLTVTLSTQDTAKLFEQLNSCLKRVINWNKYLSQNPVSTKSNFKLFG